MHAQILVAEEMEDLAAQVTNAVLAVLVHRAEQLTDPGLRSAVGAVVTAARKQLSDAPVDPEPLVRAILYGEPIPHPPVDEASALAAAPAAWADPATPAATAADAAWADAAAPAADAADAAWAAPAAAAVAAVAAPSYWPAVPEISDELFAEYAENGPKKHGPNKPDVDLSGFFAGPQAVANADAAHVDGSPAAAPEPAAGPAPDPNPAEDPGTEPNPAHGGRFHARPLRRKKSHRQ